ncbi:MAG TPA: transcriptional regulator, partial [Porphyromonadaceae bacterium]|nr:transcriptional regulator [Porphyromonadaceae bacterium]
MVKYLQKNFDSAIKIDKLTSLVPLSRRSIESKFKNEMGISLYQFILNLRIEHFTFLLTTTNLSISDIIFKSGFNDYSNVFRLFRKIKGCT